ncbi:MAG: caspase family protein [Gemmatimonadaceae bacterium]
MPASASALCIGVNQLDPRAYGGFKGFLYGAVRDAEAMVTIATAQGMSVASLTDEYATTSHVLDHIKQVADSAVAGDLFMLTFSGHGAQLPDRQGEEADRLDETWCLYDRELVDDEIYDALAAFKPGVRVLVVLDSCHSGSVVADFAPAVDPSTLGPTFGSGVRSRQLPREVELQNRERNGSTRQGTSLQINHSNVLSNLQASVLVLSACADDEEAYETDGYGDFTSALVDVWNGGDFTGGYEEFMSRIAERLTRQTPGRSWGNAEDPAFLASSVFTTGAGALTDGLPADARKMSIQTTSESSVR